MSKVLLCDICSNQKPISEFSTLGSHCKNKNDACVSCRSCQFRVVKNIFQTNGHNPSINCVYCRAPLKYKDIEEILEYGWKIHGENLLHKFQLANLERTIPNFIKCAHQCGSGGYHDGDSNIVFCDGCRESTCVQHRIPFHHGLTCEEFDEKLLQNDIISQKLISKLAKQCPQCTAWIEKRDDKDCDHMKCRCGWEFCFRCGADYQQIREHGNHYHKPSCAFYSAYNPQNNLSLLE